MSSAKLHPFCLGLDVLTAYNFIYRANDAVCGVRQRLGKREVYSSQVNDKIMAQLSQDVF